MTDRQRRSKANADHVTRRRRARAVACAVLSLALSACRPATTERGQFEVLGVTRAGCASGDLQLTVDRRQLGGGRYLVRTQLSVDGASYMDERATIFFNGSSDWRLFDDHSWPTAGAAARWPLPRGRPLRIDVTLLRPIGTVVDRQAVVIDACERGTLLLRSALHGDGFEA